jgi:hypothetical protein
MGRLLPCLIGIAACLPAVGQNNDLSLMLSGISVGTRIDLNIPSTDTSARAAAYINYGRRIATWNSSDLFLDFPLIGAGDASARTGLVASTEATALLAFTPGVRWRLFPRARVSPYLTGGIGPAWIEGGTVRVGNTKALLYESKTSAAGSFGGGVHLRIARWFGLRAEVRDILLFSEPVVTGRNRLLWGGGAAFSF